jgi:hypothetical protein
MLSNRQRKLVADQREDEFNSASDSFLGSGGSKFKINVGDRIDFIDDPEHSGVVTKISNDQWKNVSIDYGVPGRSHILFMYKIAELVRKEKAIITPAPKEEKTGK